MLDKKDENLEYDIANFNSHYKGADSVETFIIHYKTHMNKATSTVIFYLKEIMKHCDIKSEEKTVISEIIKKEEKQLEQEDNFLNKILNKYCKKIENVKIIENLNIKKQKDCEKYSNNMELFPDYYYLLEEKIHISDMKEHSEKYKNKIIFFKEQKKFIENSKLSDQLKNIILKKYNFEFDVFY
ncbi:hypothetical protein [Sebaldella sp. S0638]|uniref:hypothetical protein n=1 Tax=Sebaldella sp. S0638 TaxID=2957809 RepID=UPI0020A0C39D|nr:hypothetical protein [Sebaldella sp. S0638]MCP1225498.1 hypothetical protein [Sebaldella sp. S0638]